MPVDSQVNVQKSVKRVNSIPNIKGVSLMNLQRFVAANHGDEGLKRLNACLSASHVHALNSSAAHDWCSLQTYVDIELEVIRLFYSGDLSKASLIGMYDMKVSLGKIYRFLIRMLTPLTIIERASRLWHNFNDQGELVVESVTKTSANVHLLDFNPVHHVFCQDLKGSFIGILSLAGEKSITIQHRECVLHHSDRCVFEASWKEPNST